MRFRFRQVTANEAWSRIALLIEWPQAEGQATPTAVEVKPVSQPGFDDEPTSGLYGPTCPYTRTLKTAYPWKKVNSTSANAAVVETWLAEIPETCLWEPVHPFLYDAIFDDASGRRIVESRIGIRTLSVGENAVLLNGAPRRLRGFHLSHCDEPMLRRVRDAGCEFVDGAASDLEIFDEFGPFVICRLGADYESAMQAVAAAGPTRPGIGIWKVPESINERQLQQVKLQDPATIFAREFVSSSDAAPVAAGADLLFIECALERIAPLAEEVSMPFVAIVAVVGDTNSVVDRWAETVERLDKVTAAHHCIGFIAIPQG